MRKLATRIIELDRGRLAGWACDYDTYLVRKQEVLEARRSASKALFDKKLAQEEAWLRRGVALAQRSRAQSRINQLMQMRAERSARRDRTGNVTLRLAEAEKSGIKVIEADKASLLLGRRPDDAVRFFHGDHAPGTRSGSSARTARAKSDALIKLLLGQLQPTSGLIKHGTQARGIGLFRPAPPRPRSTTTRPSPTISPTVIPA